MTSELQTMKQRVYNVLERNIEARSDDHIVIFEIWKEDYKKLTGIDTDHIPLTLRLLKKLSFPETIRRVRAVIQNDIGLFRPTKNVEELREVKQRNYPENLIAVRKRTLF